MTQPESVVLIEDHPLMRESVVHTLGQAGWPVVGEASNAEDGYALVGETKPLVAIVDIRLGSDSGIELTRRLLRRNGDLGVIIYTGSEDAVALRDALDSGARGLVFKTTGSAILLTAVRAVGRGGTYVDEEVRAQLRTLERDGVKRVLSEREREVIDLLSRGLTSEDVALQLSLSGETVKTHVRNAMGKLGAQNRTHAVVLALRNGEISL